MENQAVPPITRVDEPLPYAIMGEYVDEQYLTNEIDNLWASRECFVRAMNNQRADMRSQDARLSEMLFTMKAVLSKPGRSGGWSAWLKQRKIPRATADRLISRYAESKGLTTNRLSEAIPEEPSDTEIGKLGATIWAKCEKTLTTPWSRYLFVSLFLRSAELTYECRENGMFVFDPENKSEPVATIATVPKVGPEAEAIAIESGDIFTP